MEGEYSRSRAMELKQLPKCWADEYHAGFVDFFEIGRATQC